MKKDKSNGNRKEAWSKTRIYGNIVELRRDVSRLNERRKDTFEFEKKDFDRKERKYTVSLLGIVQVLDIKPPMLKKLLKFGAIFVDTWKF